MKMRKYLALFLALIIAMGVLTGCRAPGGTGAPGGSATPGSAGNDGEPVDTPSNGGVPVKIICGYGAGGTADLVARMYGQVANRIQSKYNFTVENMTGGDGFTAATFFSKEDPSAMDLLVYGYGVIYRHDLGKQFATEEVDFDRNKMDPIGIVDDRTWILYTTPDQTLASILDKAKSGGIKMSGGNPLSDCHLEFGSLIKLIGGNVMVVPYDGGAAQKKGLLDGGVDVFVGTTQAAIEDVEAGTLIPILAFSDVPFEGFVGPDGPIDVPTVAGPTKASELDTSIDFSGCILSAGGSLATHRGADEAFIADMEQIMKDVWNEAEFNGWISSQMLNHFEIYGDECEAFMNAAAKKAITAYGTLSGT